MITKSDAKHAGGGSAFLFVADDLQEDPAGKVRALTKALFSLLKVVDRTR